jgi:hypothetical protein
VIRGSSTTRLAATSCAHAFGIPAPLWDSAKVEAFGDVRVGYVLTIYGVTVLTFMMLM